MMMNNVLERELHRDHPGEVSIRKELEQDAPENNHMHGKVWYMSENCYNTIQVKWILKQPKGADVFIFYQKLFVLTVQLDTERLPYNQVNPDNDAFIDTAIHLLLKVGLIEEETHEGVVWIHVPDNDVLRRSI